MVEQRVAALQGTYSVPRAPLYDTQVLVPTPPQWQRGRLRHRHRHCARSQVRGNGGSRGGSAISTVNSARLMAQKRFSFQENKWKEFFHSLPEKSNNLKFDQIHIKITYICVFK